MRKGLFLAVAAVLLCAVAGAETDAPQVLGVTGVAEVLRASEKSWSPLTAALELRPGDRVRTREKSSADFGFDRALSGMARLGEKTDVRLTESSWALERGKMWVLWEYENEVRAPFEMVLAGLSVRIEGGGYVQSDPGKVEIRSFGSVRVVTRGDGPEIGQLAEGFRGVVTDGAAGPAQRLMFADYQDWRAWMTEAYRYKDEQASKRLP